MSMSAGAFGWGRSPGGGPGLAGTVDATGGSADGRDAGTTAPAATGRHGGAAGPAALADASGGAAVASTALSAGATVGASGGDPPTGADEAAAIGRASCRERVYDDV